MCCFHTCFVRFTDCRHQQDRKKQYHTKEDEQSSLPCSDRGFRPRILDLGCGTGLLGIVAGLCKPSAHVTFVEKMPSKSSHALFLSAVLTLGSIVPTNHD